MQFRSFDSTIIGGGGSINMPPISKEFQSTLVDVSKEQHHISGISQEMQVQEESLDFN